MSYVNSTNPYWINGAQALAAPAVKASGMEVLSMAYMVAEVRVELTLTCL